MKFFIKLLFQALNGCVSKVIAAIHISVIKYSYRTDNHSDLERRLAQIYREAIDEATSERKADADNGTDVTNK